ncbi:hypothetical protein, partial [uncultured Bilophila sp.]|uniref:hypothetical protein n=1 Tax=uncultured Bilophila sp. TaxID=529385 RepID=UPI0025F6DFAD
CKTANQQKDKKSRTYLETVPRVSRPHAYASRGVRTALLHAEKPPLPKGNLAKGKRFGVMRPRLRFSLSDQPCGKTAFAIIEEGPGSARYHQNKG